MPGRGLPPSSRSSAWASTVLPAPVSPVSALSPGPRRSSARSISSRFSTRSSWSMGSTVYQPSGTDRPSVTKSLRLFRQPSEALAQAVVEARTGELRERRLRESELDVDVLPRWQLARRATVDVDLDRLLAARVVDREEVVGRDHERPRGERVRGDEGDDEAAYAPRQDRAAVGEVVAGRALRGSDDEPVAAHAPDLLPRQPVREVGDAHAGLAVDRDVVDRGPAAVGAPDPDGRQLEPLEVAGEGTVEVLAQPVGVQRGEEADLAEVDREHGDAGAGEGAQAGEDRAVAAEHDAEVDVGVVRLDELDPLAALDSVLAHLLCVEHERRAGAPRCVDELAQGVGRAAVAAAVGLAHRPHRAIHTNVSRLPAGPGRPDSAVPRTS